MLIAGFAAVVALGLPIQDRVVGPWTTWDVRDPIDDSRRAGASIAGEGGRLRVKCDSVGEGVYVELATVAYLGESVRRSDDLGRRAMVRFDEDPAAPMHWTYGPNYALLRQGLESDAFIRRLRTAERLTIRVSTFEFDEVDVGFALSDSAEALTIVEDACKATAAAP